jgi:cytochrome c5
VAHWRRGCKTKTLCRGCFLSVLVLCLASVMMSASAFHPISSRLDFVGSYPVYPGINYGSGDQAAAIKRGEYLVQVGDCIACHTATQPDSKAFSGGLPIPTPFGTFFTPNITPDSETGIGRWSEADFIKAMHEGVRPDGSNSFPAFPYVFFNRVKEADLKDIWTYLQAVPAVGQKNKDNTLPFPLDVRFAQYGWKLLFFYPDRNVPAQDPARSAMWNRGAYLVEGLGHCSMCHTSMNLLGAQKKSEYLTGAFLDGYWAPDITRQGLATAPRYQIAEVFSEGELINKAGKVRGPMADAIHDSLQYLTQTDRLAIAEYLQSVETPQPRDLPARKAGQASLKRGAQVYANACSLCHLDGEAGAPRLKDNANWYRRVQQNTRVVLYRHAIDGFNNMPARGACVSCEDDDVRAAVDYMLYRALDESQRREQAGKAVATRHNVRTGKQVYETTCSSCHATGEQGAPVTGDQTQWQPLLKRNFDVLISNTLQGINDMPAMGGCSDCSGSEVIAAVKYMVQQSQTSKDYSLW